MTTIAYKGGVLAADMGNWADGRIYIATKLTMGIHPTLGAIAYAQCGMRSFSELMKDALFAGAGMPDWRQFPDHIHNAGEGCGFVMTHDGRYGKLTVCGQVLFMLDEFVGEGGGASFVEGVMSAGRTAKEAVELAITYTDYARHGVQVVTVDHLVALQKQHDEQKQKENPDWVTDYTPPAEYCTRDGLTGYDPLIPGAYELAGMIARNHGRLPLKDMSDLQFKMLARQVVKVVRQRSDDEISAINADLAAEATRADDPEDDA